MRGDGANRLVLDMDDGRGFERGADALLAAFDFERAEHDAAHRAQALPPPGEFAVAPAAVTGQLVTVRVEAAIRSDSPFKSALPLLRLPDYSGLTADGEQVYALFRNAHLVVRLEKTDGQWRETAAWSYRHIETRPDLAYQSQTYGQAEGLVVDGRDVYLIFDNNLGPRQADSRDRRPLLIHARFP